MKENIFESQEQEGQEPKIDESQQEKQEEEKPEPGRICVYAIEETITHDFNVRDDSQTAFTKTRLEKPIKKVLYRCEGVLYPTKDEQGRGSRTGRSLFTKENIKGLVESFSYAYLDHSGDYTFIFNPSKEIKKQVGNVDSRIRALTDEEEKLFVDSFQKANKEITDKRGAKEKDRKRNAKKALPPPPPKPKQKRKNPPPPPPPSRKRK